MEHEIKLRLLLLSNSLTPEEKLIAEYLLVQRTLHEILDKVEKAELIILPHEDLCGFSLSTFLTFLPSTCYVLPIYPMSLMTVSSTLSAEYSASTVCAFLKKLFPQRKNPFIGVVCLKSGISINNSTTPGSMIWRLTTCDAISMCVKSIRLTVAVSFVDSATMAPVTAFKVFLLENLNENLTPGELASKASRLITAPSDTEGGVWSPRELISSVLPNSYFPSRIQV